MTARSTRAGSPPPSSAAVAIIMAAGLGTRMHSALPKVLHPICGRPMLGYVIDAAREATGSTPIVVYSPATAAICDVFAGQAAFALQDDPRGTGDAVRAALDAVPTGAADIVVLSGDVPLVAPSLVAELVAARRADAAVMSLVSFEALEPGSLGRVIRESDESDRVLRIVEVRDASEDDLDSDEVNAGIYAFDAAWLRTRIGDLAPSAATGELYLTELVALARENRRAVTSFLVEDDGTLGGINDRAELAEAEGIARDRIRLRHLRAGVTMIDPSTVYVDDEVELARDVTLEQSVILRGRTRVGEGTVIGAGSQIVDSIVGRDCRIWASVLESSEVEDGVRVGPYSHLRPGASIGRGAEIGNFAEVKNSRVGAGVRQHHMSYLGDADVGEGTNVGAGTITANFDGRRKHRTTIGAHVFLGVDTMLRAPVTIGDGAKTGAGAVVTRDVPPGTLAVGVPARIRALTPDGPDVDREPPAGS